MSTDSELLLQYVNAGLQQAFAALVERHIAMVYSVALRQSAGDVHLAQDVTQTVFSVLAQKAEALSRRPALVGWLYRATQFAATDAIRRESRRRIREAQMEILPADSSAAGWDRIRPLLDEAIAGLPDRDRDAVLLRFFHSASFPEIAARLRLTESGARMRIERALDKLGAALGRHGIKSTAAALGIAVANQGGAVVPASLVSNICSAVTLAGTGVGVGGWAALFMAMTKTQMSVLGVAVVAGFTAYVVQVDSNADIRAELAALRDAEAEATRLRAENAGLGAVASEIERLRGDDRELRELAENIAETRRTRAELARQTAARDHLRSLQAEIDRVNREGNAMVEKFKELSQAAKAASLTPEARTAANEAVKAQLEAIKAKQREAQALRATGLAAFPDQKEEFAGPRESQTVTLSVGSALEAYEAMAGARVVRDPSLQHVTGTFELRIVRGGSAAGLAAIRTALREHLNVILEPAADGTVVARLGSSR